MAIGEWPLHELFGNPLAGARTYTVSDNANGGVVTLDTRANKANPAVDNETYLAHLTVEWLSGILAGLGLISKFWVQETKDKKSIRMSLIHADPAIERFWPVGQWLWKEDRQCVAEIKTATEEMLRMGGDKKAMLAQELRDLLREGYAGYQTIVREEGAPPLRQIRLPAWAYDALYLDMFAQEWEALGRQPSRQPQHMYFRDITLAIGDRVEFVP